MPADSDPEGQSGIADHEVNSFDVLLGRGYLCILHCYLMYLVTTT